MVMPLKVLLGLQSQIYNHFLWLLLVFLDQMPFYNSVANDTSWFDSWMTTYSEPTVSVKKELLYSIYIYITVNNIHRNIIDLCQFLECVKFLKRYAHPQGKAVGIWWNVHVAKPFTNINTTPEIAHIVEKWQNWRKIFTGQCRNKETLSMALALYDMNPLVTSRFPSWRANNSFSDFFVVSLNYRVRELFPLRSFPWYLWFAHQFHAQMFSVWNSLRF